MTGKGILKQEKSEECVKQFQIIYNAIKHVILQLNIKQVKPWPVLL